VTSFFMNVELSTIPEGSILINVMIFQCIVKKQALAIYMKIKMF